MIYSKWDQQIVILFCRIFKINSGVLYIMSKWLVWHIAYTANVAYRQKPSWIQPDNTYSFQRGKTKMFQCKNKVWLTGAQSTTHMYWSFLHHVTVMCISLACVTVRLIFIVLKCRFGKRLYLTNAWIVEIKAAYLCRNLWMQGASGA